MGMGTIGQRHCRPCHEQEKVHLTPPWPPPSSSPWLGSISLTHLPFLLLLLLRKYERCLNIKGWSEPKANIYFDLFQFEIWWKPKRENWLPPKQLLEPRHLRLARIDDLYMYLPSVSPMCVDWRCRFNDLFLSGFDEIVGLGLFLEFFSRTNYMLLDADIHTLGWVGLGWALWCSSFFHFIRNPIKPRWHGIASWKRNGRFFFFESRQR